MEIREGKQKYKNREGAKHKRLLNTGEQIEGCWRGVEWGNGLNEQGVLRRTLVGMSTGCYM